MQICRYKVFSVTAEKRKRFCMLAKTNESGYILCIFTFTNIFFSRKQTFTLGGNALYTFSSVFVRFCVRTKTRLRFFVAIENT